MKKTLTLVFCTIQFLMSLTITNAQELEEYTTLNSKIDNYLNEGAENGFSGSILVAKKGEIILHKGYGMANKENKIPYKTTTVSTIGSVTKQFTATAILKLVELKKLKVEDPLSKFFPKIPNDKKDITLHQLLTHSSGLIDGIGEGDFDDIPMEQFFNILFSTKLLHKPGTKHAYSNAGYSILARIIEIASGQNYELFLNENLFKPAGMRQTGYFIPKWDNNLIASGYALNIVSVGTLVSRYQKIGKVTWNLKGNGGILSTTEDMFKWYQALKTYKILPENLFKKLTTPYILEHENGSSQYAYGWVIYHSKRNTKIISHNGGNQIFFHDYIWMPEEDAVIILFTNASSKEAEVAWPIEKMLFDRAYKANPIKRNLYDITFDFIKNSDLRQTNELISVIKKDYCSGIKNPSELNSLGYRILNNEIMEIEENVKWAITIFKLNTELFPNEGNVWDSLGEAYTQDNQKKVAIKSYKRALELAPNENCDWCESSIKALDKLRKDRY